MDAIEFVKNIGIERVAELVNECPEDMPYIGKCGFSKIHWNEFACKNDLKQIVDAFEIIDLFKSLDHAKLELTACEAAMHSQILVKLGVGVGYIDTNRVKQAIELVEKCNASD